MLKVAEKEIRGKPDAEIKGKFFNVMMDVAFNLVLSFFNMVIHTFFRDIVVRGSFNIPKEGPVVFVIAPHHNQFIDAIVVMSKVKQHSGRQASLLIANKSYQRSFIGTCAMLCGSIPVERAQDLLSTKSGTIKVDETNSLKIIGHDTQFTKDCEIKGLLGLPSSLSSVQIESIEDATHLTLKKPFKLTLSQLRIDKLLAQGTTYKTAPHIDNNIVFSNVFNHLNSGKDVGIFPEGGSHDRPDLLPLKPGVAIMALGAVASQIKNGQYEQPVQVIPVGLNYFHPHKFRSRVVIEFGKPIQVDGTMAQEYIDNSRESVGKLLESITLHLKEVTVTCDDIDTLLSLQAARRLYTSGDRGNIPLPLVVEMNRRLVKGYKKYQHEPDLIALKELVMNYNRQLTQYGLHDHQVEDLYTISRVDTVIRFLTIFTKSAIFIALSIPGVILFSPVFITAKRISYQKAKEALKGSTVKIKAIDVLGTWKILVALALAPILYITYAAIATVYVKRNSLIPNSGGIIPTTLIFGAFYSFSVFTTYASLRVGEIGVDHYKTMVPLFISMVSRHSEEFQVESLKKTRLDLSFRVNELCSKYGPGMFDDFEKFYREYNGNNFEDYIEVHGVKKEDFDLDNLSDVQIFSNDVEDSNDNESHDSQEEDPDKVEIVDHNKGVDDNNEESETIRKRKT